MKCDGCPGHSFDEENLHVAPSAKHCRIRSSYLLNMGMGASVVRDMLSPTFAVCSTSERTKKRLICGSCSNAFFRITLKRDPPRVLGIEWTASSSCKGGGSQSVKKISRNGVPHDPIADSGGERRIIFPQSTAVGGTMGFDRFVEVIQLGFLSNESAPRIENQVVDAVCDNRVAFAIHNSNLSRGRWLSRPKTGFVGNVKTGKRCLRVLFEFIRCRALSRPCYVSDDLAAEP